MSERVTKRLKAARILDRAGGKMSFERLREAMGADWTSALRDNLTIAKIIVPPGQRGTMADFVLTELGYAYARGEVATKSAPTPAPPPPPVRTARPIEAPRPPPPAAPVEVPDHVRPLLARRDALAAEVKRLDAALAALGVDR